MNFIKKIWKRGDRLTAKELNRLEDGISTALNNTNAGSNNNNNGSTIITFDIVPEDPNDDKSDQLAQNFSTEITESFIPRIKSGENIKLIGTIQEENSEIQTIILYPTTVEIWSTGWIIRFDNGNDFLIVGFDDDEPTMELNLK